LRASQSFLRTLTIQCQHRTMQNVVAVPATAENLGIQEASRYRLAASLLANVRTTLSHRTQKLTTGILGAVLLSASALCASATNACIQAKEQFSLQNNNSIDSEIKAPAGRDVRLGIYSSIRSDCNSGPLPSMLAVAPERGTVTVQRATLKATNLKQCLAVEALAFVVFYHSDRDFDGADRFELEIDFAESRKQVQHFLVNVSQAPAGSEGIRATRLEAARLGQVTKLRWGLLSGVRLNN
jgi:hypothetical protein